MKKNVSKKELLGLQIGMAFIFFVFVLFLFLPKSYIKTYKINDIEVLEKYNKKDKIYYFTFKKGEVILDFLSEVKYSNDRKLVNKIELKEDNNNFCLIPSSKKIDFKPLCVQDDKNIHYSLVNDELKKSVSKFLKPENKLIETYESYDIYNNTFTYLLWNYDSFFFINKDAKKKIKLLDKELYTVNNIGYTKDYLVIPNYELDYVFNNYYTISFKDGNLKNKKLDRNIYFDSYFIGYVKNKAYIIDNKESAMYEFDAKNGDLEKIKAKVLNNGIWENVNIKTLLNKKQEFSYKTNYIYTLDNNKIYLNYKNSEINKLVADDVTCIIRIKDKDIFYLKKDTLYHFNEMVGEEKLITHYEWNFNNSNMIFIN